MRRLSRTLLRECGGNGKAIGEAQDKVGWTASSKLELDSNAGESNC